MDVLRVVDAFCASCDEVQQHAVPVEDPGACYCNACGACQVLVEPVAEPVVAGPAALGLSSPPSSEIFG